MLLICEYGHGHSTTGDLLYTRDGRSICLGCARLSRPRLDRQSRRLFRLEGKLSRAWLRAREARHG